MVIDVVIMINYDLKVKECYENDTRFNVHECSKRLLCEDMNIQMK